MYYSSSSSSDDNEKDDRSKDQPGHLHPIDSDPYYNDDKETILHPSTSGQMDTEGICECGAGGVENVDRGPDSPSRSSSNRLKEDDRVEISTLLLEEKIVSLMNRVWILETENDVIRSRWKKRDKDGQQSDDIEDLYRNPYDSPTKNGGDTNLSIFPEDNDFTLTGDNHSPRKNMNQDETATSEDPPSLEQQNQSLRVDLAISEEIQERMRGAMVSLENCDKRRSDRVEELSNELEDAAKQHKQAMETLQNELQVEEIKRQKLQTDLEEERSQELEDVARKHKKAMEALQNELEIEKIKRQKLQTDFEEETRRITEENTKFAGVEKECIDRSTGLVAYQTSSTAKAAELISDLSNELKLTMERESQLKDELDDFRRERKEDKAIVRAIEKELLVSRDQHQREKNTLLKHNEELESLNIDLIRKFNTLESQCEELMTKADQGNNNQRDTYSNRNSNEKEMRAMEDYLYSLSIKYEESQKEIASLKTRLALRETTIAELRSKASPAKRPPARSKESSRISQRTRMQIQHDRISHIVRSNEEDRSIYHDSPSKDSSLHYHSDDDFTSRDEQREDESFAGSSFSFADSSYSRFPNRAEI
eukprot:CAMPEP_0116090836 /NCGR_PEP_ID=MMETSP0327-20121206/7181_1 /TAXON_ID=44447 /ORGANISM="Pseudo-nitzschia delicatissima, Strain B596" /LENGTH=594 /DNA_ID=CAMNT_0003582141 /DNA_START=188 /DNA_END=1972 /DNA_ORIENTATION=+